MSAHSGGEDATNEELMEGFTPAITDENDTIEKETWAAVLGRSLTQRQNKNVLEVILEKDLKGSFVVSDLECAKFLAKIGLDTRPGMQIDGIQICPSGRGVIYITLKDFVDASKFSRYDVIDVTNSGIRAAMIKPAGKREVILSITGIHPNTSDQSVFDYLDKFGKLASKRVIYGVYTTGPLTGIKNGNRSYKLELEPGVNIGSYHVLDGHKVSIRYPGQQQTCARCLEISRVCKGKGIARNCEAAGGNKMDFPTYIANMWRKIGYSPEDSSLEGKESYIEQQIGGEYTPIKVVSSPNRFSGISLKNLPKEHDYAKVVELLVESGLPENRRDYISFGLNGNVTIRNLDNEVCLLLIENLHGKKHFSRRIYCNGLIAMTPEKNTTENRSDTQEVSISSSPTGTGDVPAAFQYGATSPHLTPSKEVDDNLGRSFSDNNLPSLISPLASPTWPTFQTEDLVRRHSISLLNRTPPKDSLAAELLGLPDASSVNKKSLSSIKDIQENLSNFISCVSSLSQSDGSDADSSVTKSTTRKRKKKKSPQSKKGQKKVDNKVSPDKPSEATN